MGFQFWTKILDLASECVSNWFEFWLSILPCSWFRFFWAMCEQFVVGLNVKSRAHVESICVRGLLGLLFRTQDEVWNFFKKLVWNTYEFEQVGGTLGDATHGKYVFHANPYHYDHFMNSDDTSYSYVPLILCDTVSLLIMVFIIVLIVTILMLHVQVVERRWMN